MDKPQLPQIGERAPTFEAIINGEIIRFPDVFQGHWSILFSHPANFSSGWIMYSTVISMKEEPLLAINTKLLALSHQIQPKNNVSKKVRRYSSYIGIDLNAPIVQDPKCAVANLYGMATGRQKEQSIGRLAYIIDPVGIIQSIVENPQPSIEMAIKLIEASLYETQSQYTTKLDEPPKLKLIPVDERLDVDAETMPTNPAYFNRENLLKN